MQPFVHELVTCLSAPATALGRRDGQICPGGAEGVHWLDIRFLNELVLRVDGRSPEPLGFQLLDPSSAEFVGTAIGIVTDLADPTVRVIRTRRVTGGPDHLVEEIEIVNDSRLPIDVPAELSIGCDLGPLAAVKGGHEFDITAVCEPRVDGATWTADERSIDVSIAAIHGVGAVTVNRCDSGITASWNLRLPPRNSQQLVVTCRLADPRSTAWFRPAAKADAGATAQPSDLDALMLDDGAGNVFAAAGSPWFVTMFGRDSIWAARLVLPDYLELAGGTLRALAARQATATDDAISAEPGKILHEVRIETVTYSTGDRASVTIPREYYGTVDATPLWISLLRDAQLAGMPNGEVAELLGALEAALSLVRSHCETTGYLSYRDLTGRGLANQGWKDSGDSIQFADGSLATPPITLCEVQAYAYRALLDGAALLDEFDRPGGDAARTTAAALAKRFRREFWVERDGLRYPAVAIDGTGRTVDSLTSNIGHLLGTGLLDATEEAIVATLLADDRLSSGYGLRTLAADHPQFNPLGYHSGSVWPHDTAIAVRGLRAGGHHDVADELTAGVIAAAAHFGNRLPELYGGRSRAEGPPLAYPAACAPQAWSAAALIALVAMKT